MGTRPATETVLITCVVCKSLMAYAVESGSKGSTERMMRKLCGAMSITDSTPVSIIM